MTKDILKTYLAHCDGGRLTPDSLQRTLAERLREMQGELAGSANHSRPEPEDVASYAVKCADALLAELDK